jgi:hypothetical protein
MEWMTKMAPAPSIKNLAKDAGVSKVKSEKLWDKAKKIVKKQYKYKESDPRYWALVMGIIKKMMGIKKESISFVEFNALAEAEALEIIALDITANSAQNCNVRNDVIAQFLSFVEQRKQGMSQPMKPSQNWYNG